MYRNERSPRLVLVGLSAAILLALLMGLLAAPAAWSTAPVACTERITNGGFEAGSQGWVQYSKLGFQLIDALFPHTGALGAWLGAEDNAYDQLKQQVTLPSGVSSTRLTFWWALMTEESAGAFDYLVVELDSGDGSTPIRLSAIDNTGSEAWVWNYGELDLTAYAGRTVWVRFTATTDGLNPTHFFVDDVSIQSCTDGGSVTATATSGGLTRTPTATLSPGSATVTPTRTPTATSTRTPTVTATLRPGTATSTPTNRPPGTRLLYLPLVLFTSK